MLSSVPAIAASVKTAAWAWIGDGESSGASSVCREVGEGAETPAAPLTSSVHQQYFCAFIFGFSFEPDRLETFI